MTVGCSKRQLERKLHRAWSTLLVLRREASEAVVQHLSSLTKRRIAEGRIDETEIGMIQDVERLGAELQVDLVAQPELLPGGEVDLCSTETTGKITGGIAHNSSSWDGKCGRIDCFAAWILTPI